ncbi:Bug family tripartite tricarboxylate transporter substrate binding protein [Roseomonas marmotae]|uniref:Tripartite tricarboxylate transporter substrate binding protein n=1 Tax=Roseomonas marmotae TaxID=2768161 RepID=A0ABS3KHG9_9PROT|nr:tripartite tricarboxylate transporter substrate binding protein [Roseomonas marmotae]MBO1076915.1 tripartite tricarboxylate transporter substrate binding protein [Roseomonas marmotae]
MRLVFFSTPPDTRTVRTSSGGAFGRRATLAGAAAILARPALAQQRGGGPIRLVVGFPPGGSGDVFARLLADPLREELGRTLIVENRPGAGGLTAAEYALRAPADGSVLMMHTGSSAVSAPIARKVPPYDPVRDFSWVALLSEAPFALALNPRLPATDLEGFIAYAKERPGQLSYSSAGIGTTVHLAAEAFNDAAGIQVLHIPYQGSGPAITDAINGTVAYNVETFGTLLPHHRGGALRIVSAMAAERTSIAPEIPTMREDGIDVTAGTYNLLAAPPNTPNEVLAPVAAAVGRLMARPAMQAQLQALGISGVVQSDPEGARRFVAAEIARWTPVVQRLGLAL